MGSPRPPHQLGGARSLVALIRATTRPLKKKREADWHPVPTLLKYTLKRQVCQYELMLRQKLYSDKSPQNHRQRKTDDDTDQKVNAFAEIKHREGVHFFLLRPL